MNNPARRIASGLFLLYGVCWPLFGEEGMGGMQEVTDGWRKAGLCEELKTEDYFFCANKETKECFIAFNDNIIFSKFFTAAKVGGKMAIISSDPTAGVSTNISIENGLAVRVICNGPDKSGTSYATVDGDGDGTADLIIEYINGMPKRVKRIPKFDDLPDSPWP